MRRWRLGLAAVLVLACGGGATPGPGVKAPIPHGGAPAAARARWLLEGYEDFRATASVRTEDGELFFGPRGERLLRTGSQLTAAEELLPETIVSAQLRDGALRLLGTSGTVYVGAKALGTMTANLSPFDGARAASASASALFVLDRAGKLHRSSDGRAWTDVALPGLSGIATNVAMSGKSGLVTALPPQLFATTDEGQTFALVDAPSTGVSQVVVDRDDVLVRGASGWSRFEPPNKFTAAAAPGLWSPRWAPRTWIVRALDGDSIAELTPNGERSITVHPLGKPGTAVPLDGVLPSCATIDLAMSGDVVGLRCEEGGADRRTSIFESTDRGKTFALAAKLEGGGPAKPGHAAIAVGSGGALFVGERCKDVWSENCAPAVARTTKEGAFVPITTGVALAARFDPKRGGFLVVTSDRERTKLLRVTTAIEDLGVLVPNASTVATIGLGADGTAGIMTGTTTQSGDELAAFVTTQAAFRPVSIPTLQLKSGAMAGTSGLVLSASGRAYETTDGASWHEVLAPANAHAILGCSSSGCLADRGVRIGWDDATTTRARRPAARPALRCKPTGARTPIGSIGAPPRASAIDHGPYRFVLPVRDGDGGVRALRGTWADPPERFATTEVLGPAQQYPAYGTRAVLLTQTGGVIAARYTWKRLHFAGTFNPVTLDVAWLRDGEPLPHRVAATLPPFRSSTEFVSDAIESATLPEILSLGSGGVHWRAPLATGDLAVGRFFDERGAERKVAMPVDVTGDRALVTGDRDVPLVAADRGGDLVVADLTEKRSLVVLPGVDDGDRSLALTTLGGKTIAIATHRRAGRSFAFPIAPTASKVAATAAFELPTQGSLESAPICTASSPGEPLDLPWVDGARRPVRVVESGTERLFVTDRARVRVSGNAVTCVSGFDAQPLDRPTATVLLFGNGARALLVELGTPGSGGGTLQALACAADSSDLPTAYSDVPGVGD